MLSFQFRTDEPCWKGLINEWMTTPLCATLVDQADIVVPSTLVTLASVSVNLNQTQRFSKRWPWKKFSTHILIHNTNTLISLCALHPKGIKFVILFLPIQQVAHEFFPEKNMCSFQQLLHFSAPNCIWSLEQTVMNCWIWLKINSKSP